MKAILILINVLILASCAENPITLNIKITRVADALLIENLDKFYYHDVSIVVNEKFVQKIPSLKIRETAILFIEDFVDDRGTKFDLDSSIIDISIFCNLNDGQTGLFKQTLTF